MIPQVLWHSQWARRRPEALPMPMLSSNGLATHRVWRPPGKAALRGSHRRAQGLFPRPAAAVKAFLCALCELSVSSVSGAMVNDHLLVSCRPPAIRLMWTPVEARVSTVLRSG